MEKTLLMKNLEAMWNYEVNDGEETDKPVVMPAIKRQEYRALLNQRNEEYERGYREESEYREK